MLSAAPRYKLAELAHKIAATGKWTPRPGQAVVTTEGLRWRRIDNWLWIMEDGTEINSWINDRALAARDNATNSVIDALAAALAAGPDLDDAVTALSLLADLPGFRVSPFRAGARWQCWSESVDAPTGATRTEAVVLAWLKVHGG